jgi:hypothetical protein
MGGHIIRLRVCVGNEGLRQHDYGHGADVYIRAGWNDGCEMVQNTLSVNELRDLRYLIDEALRAADA